MRDACGADAMLHSSSFLDTAANGYSSSFPPNPNPGLWIVEGEVLEEPYLPTYVTYLPEAGPRNLLFGSPPQIVTKKKPHSYILPSRLGFGLAHRKLCVCVVGKRRTEKAGRDRHILAEETRRQTTPGFSCGSNPLGGASIPWAAFWPQPNPTRQPPRSPIWGFTVSSSQQQPACSRAAERKSPLRSGRRSPTSHAPNTSTYRLVNAESRGARGYYPWSDFAFSPVVASIPGSILPTNRCALVIFLSTK